MQRSANGLSSGWSYRPNWSLKSLVLLDPPLALRREGRTAPIRRMGDQRGSGLAIDDRYPRAPLPIDLAVLRAAQSTLITQRLIALVVHPSARDGPWVSGAPICLSCWPLDRVDFRPCEHRTLILFPLEWSERHVGPVPLKVRMAVGCPGNFPLSGVGGWSLRRHGRDDAGRCSCTENGEKYHTNAHFDLHSSMIHDTDRRSC